VVAALLNRSVERNHTLAFHLAVCGIAQLEVRILAVLWNLADRWGKVRPDGVLLPMRITHELLSQLVSARRPSVSAAMGRLRERGMITANRDEGWVLHGSAPEELAHIRRQLAAGA
jgi:CRP-like cAMP-binding protein